MSIYQADLQIAKDYIYSLLERTISEEAQHWLCEKLKNVEKSTSGKDLYLAFSATPRYIGKGALEVRSADLEKARLIRSGFDPSYWTVAQAARTLLLLSIPHQDQAAFLHQINQLLGTAEMGELVALYASLPLLPYPASFRGIAAEGVRTNMGTVFEAIALHNPYPADYLQDDAWNQLVLKAVFVGKPLYCIYGLEKRCNATLARILSDYAHERWAAGRTVTPELWRLVGPFLNEAFLEDLKKVFDKDEQVQQEAAAMACAQSNLWQASELLKAYPVLKNRIETGELNWDYIGKKVSVTL